VLSREEWLEKAANLINDILLAKEGVSLPEKWKVSVGFPSRATAIGQAWDKAASEDEQTYQMFISPVLGNHDQIQLVQVLLHECIHLAVGNDQKHGGEFKRVARNLGLEGRLTATYVSPDNPLSATLKQIYDLVGEGYPHTSIKKQAKTPKKRDSNFLKFVSENYPSYEVKIKKDLVEDFGIPKDPDGLEMILKED